ncbi:hypothetical protein JCM8097_005171 [Rhodosporidiobolus ruineniae]
MPTTAPNPLDPSSFTHRQVLVPSGRSFHLVDQPPAHWRGDVRDAPTVLMCHGFPDLWYGWRYQIAALSSRGYRVLCPSMTGYHQSSQPDNLDAYTFKSVAYDLNGLLDEVGAGKVVVFGHDWGGMVAWRFAEYFPHRVLAVASVCTPYLPPPSPSSPSIPLEQLVKSKLPNFGYQLFFASDRAAPKLEKVLPEFLAGSFSETVRGEKRKKGEKVGQMPVKEGALEKQMDRLMQAKEQGKTRPPPTDPEYLYYLTSFSSTGLTHPLNWYRTRALNEADERAARLAERGFPAEVPALLLTVTEDPALPPSMAEGVGMKRAFERGGNLRVKRVEGADHWLLQDPLYRNKVTDMLDDFAQEVLSGKWRPEKRPEGSKDGEKAKL